MAEYLHTISRYVFEVILQHYLQYPKMGKTVTETNGRPPTFESVLIKATIQYVIVVAVFCCSLLSCVREGIRG